MLTRRCSWRLSWGKRTHIIIFLPISAIEASDWTPWGHASPDFGSYTVFRRGWRCKPASPAGSQEFDSVAVAQLRSFIAVPKVNFTEDVSSLKQVCKRALVRGAQAEGGHPPREREDTAGHRRLTGSLLRSLPRMPRRPWMTGLPRRPARSRCSSCCRLTRTWATARARSVLLLQEPW